MTYQPHVRMTFLGTLGTDTGGVEKWSFNLSADRSTDLSQSQNDAVAVALGAYIGRATTKCSIAVRTTMVKSALIGPDGRYVNNLPVMSTVTVGGANTISFPPPQIAYAVSLSTTTRRVRGRYYVPMPGCLIDGATLEYSVADAGDMLASARTFLVAVNNAVGGGLGFANGLCVASGVGTGANAILTKLRVGRAADTIRSRRRSLVENYLTQTLP